MATLPARKLSAGPARQLFDVIVVGGQLSGALSAALLAKRGYRVMLVEHDGLGHGYEHNGYLLPYGPFIAPPFKTMAVVDEAFVELGLATTIQRTLKPHKPELQLVLPNHRVDLPSNDATRVAELSREFGDLGPELAKRLKAAAVQHEATDWFFKQRPNLPPDGMMEAWALKRLVKAHPGLMEAPALEGADAASVLLNKLNPFITHLSETAHPLAKSRALSQVLKSPSRYPGAREAVRELLIHRLTDLGGAVVGGSPEQSIVERFEFDGSEISGVKLLKSDTLYRSHFTIAATDSGAMRRLVDDKKKFRKLIEQFDEVSTESFLYSVNWVMRPAGIPPAMGELVLMDTGDDLGTMLIQVDNARSAEGKVEDESLRVLCAGVFVPAKTRELGEQHLHDLAKRIEAHLEALMPFSRKHLVLSSSPYLNAGGVRGSRLMPHPLYKVSSDTYLGLTGLAQRTAVKNLFLANREVLPGLGLEGELLAGIRAAKLVQDMLRKANPLK
jgi:hypothetical protein